MTKAEVSGTKTANSPLGNRELPARKHRKIDDEVVALEAFDVAQGEFSDAFDLSGISEEVKQKIFEVAPVLRGCQAVYNRGFFTNVVGLCGSGGLLSKLVGFEDEIKVKWPPNKNRYEITRCKDKDEAQSFVNHWSKVYGESPDNDYFSMRFLRGCYATFVHHTEVDWVQEAVDRRQNREKKLELNPKKLGPVALRQQIEALCRVVASIEGNPHSNSLVVAKEKLQQCQEDEVKCKNLERSLLGELKAAKQSLQSCYAVEESGTLHSRYNKAIAEAKSLRATGTTKEALAKRAKAQALLAAINEGILESQELEDTIARIEEQLLPKAMAELKSASKSMEKAQQRVKELTMCPGCMDAMAKQGTRVDRAPSVDRASPEHISATSDLPSVPDDAVGDLTPAGDLAPASDLDASPHNSTVDEGLETAVPKSKWVSEVGFCEC